jgi:mRNA (guanine-N7-)-methyltransferase
MFQKNVKNMRFFHNKVKHSLLEETSSCCDNDLVAGNGILLDVGMGRGGDLLKWKKCSIKRVVGYDPNQVSVDDAKKRLTNTNTEGFDYSFHCCQDVCELDLPSNSCSIVSCQFAIHYFFSDHQNIRNLLNNVKKLLKRNGYFIGTFMNADKINESLVDDAYMNNAMMIRRKNTSSDRMGETIHVHLAGTLYFSEDCVSIEYMVYPDILVAECERVGLRLVKMTPFETHFNEMKNNMNIKMDEHHRTCSFMYSSFIFQKV